MIKYLITFFLFFNYLFSSVLSDITIDKKNIYNNFELLVYEDKTDKLTIDDIKKVQFSKKTKNRFALGRSNGSFWFKLNIKNISDKEDFILTINESFYESFEVYEAKKYSTGLKQNIEQRQIQTNKLSINLLIPKNTQKELYIKLKANFAYFGTFLLLEHGAFHLNDFFSMNTYFIFLFGVFFIIIVFNLFLFLKLRENIYFYYIGYIFFLFIYVFNISGFLAYFNLYEYIYVLQSSSCFGLMFFLLFSLKLLDAEKHLPKIDKILKCFAPILFGVGLIFFYNYKLAMQISNSLNILLIILLMSIAIFVAFKDRSKSIYYIVTVTLYHVALFIFIFMIEGVYENTIFTRYSFFFMIFIEIVVFSLLLTNRYNELKDQVIKTQSDLLESKIQNQVALENKILERTNEISKLLSDKDLLLRELHHRVKNNFHMLNALLWLELKKEESEKFDIKALINRIDAISTIHEQLYSSENLSSINIKDYLQKIISNIPYDYKKVKISTEIEDISFEFDHALSLGIVLNELLTNIIKHNLKKENLLISIKIEQKAKTIKLLLVDDGIGFDYDNIKKGLGLKLINQFTKKLPNSSSKFFFDDGRKFELEFKV